MLVHPIPFAGVPSLRSSLRRVRAPDRTTDHVPPILGLPRGVVATRATLLAGLRAATATVVPIALAYALDEPLLIWAALGGWLSTFADVGGAYRTRARAMLAYTVAGSIACLVAAVAAQRPLLAVVVVFGFAVGGALMRLYGEAATAVGSLLAVTCVASLGTASDLRGAAMRAVLFALGCVWAMLLAFVVWPFRPWAPARHAVASCYAALADFARALAGVLADPQATPEAWHAIPLAQHARLRERIEAARTTLAETRSRRAGGNVRGEDLVVLLELVDPLFETMIAAAEESESATRGLADGDAAPIRAALAACAQALGIAFDELAEHIPVPQRQAPAVTRVSGLDRAVLRLWQVVEAAEQGPNANSLAVAHAVQAAAILEQLATLTQVGAESVGALNADDRPAERVVVDAPQPHPLDVLRANLTPDSLVLRHAMRVGVVGALAVWAATAFRIPHATWVATTALIILQPYAGLTQRRGIERVTWTVLGAVVSALLAALVHDRLVIAAIMFPLSMAAIAVRAAHYGLFTFFLTPVFVLLAEPAVGDWRIAAVRILDTLIGGALALAANRFLWPSWEHRRLPSDLATMVEATRGHFRAAEGRSNDDGSVAAARRRVGLTGNNADAAFQRFVAEPRGPFTEVEALMAILTFARRLSAAVTAIVVASGGSRPTSPERAALVEAIDAALAEIAESVRAERPPAPLPEIVARYGRSRGDGTHRDQRPRVTAELPVFGVGLDRVARQTAVLHGAATRAFGGPGAARVTGERAVIQ